MQQTGQLGIYLTSHHNDKNIGFRFSTNCVCHHLQKFDPVSNVKVEHDLCAGVFASRLKRSRNGAVALESSMFMRKRKDLETLTPRVVDHRDGDSHP